MKRFTMFACLALALAFALSSYAGEAPRPVISSGNEVIHGSGVSFAKAGGDTVCLIGPASESPGALGTFQDGSGNPMWNGWTSTDYSEPTVPRWNISTYQAITGTYAVWCGDLFDPCGPGDGPEGYGNSWKEWLEWRATVTNPAASCTVDLVYSMFYDTEGCCDFVYVSHEKQDQGFIDTATYGGSGTVIAVAEQFTYAPADYIDGDQVVILFRFASDSGWSDEDCLQATDGAAVVDDVSITLSNGPDYATGFEDGTLGQFTVRFPIGCGDFAKIWTGLEDVDPCRTNYSAQAAFIDDGQVVPGTGGTSCTSWCYGPGGFIVNNTGGLAGLSGDVDATLYNGVESPVVSWTNQSHAGASLLFDVYRHENFTSTSPGIFYIWSVRSKNAAGDNIWSGWQDRNFIYYGGPNYIRAGDTAAADLFVAGRTDVQVRLAAYDYGRAGVDGTPAPYFDNVRLITFPIVGPGMNTRELDMANDNFPTNQAVDYVTLANNSVRFDAANNISPPADLLNDPGDSVTFDCAIVRDGATLNGLPRMYYKIKTNPLFDAARSVAPVGGFIEGFVECDSSKINGVAIPDRYFGDLPDENFLFPGDIVHYYFRGSDDLLGDVQFSLLPGDTTGFDNFDPQVLPGTVGAYSSTFTMRALPTVKSQTEFDHPKLLFWNDFGNRGGQQEWHGALANLGLIMGTDYDLYYTQGPSSGVGNGLGGRALIGHVRGYTDIVYTAGDLGTFTLGNSDYDQGSDPSRDTELLNLWLAEADKDIFMTGDDLAYDLSLSGALNVAFLGDKLGVSVTSNDIRPLIGGQTAPRVVAEVGNPVFSTVSSWIAFGGCLGINDFDAVQTTTGTRLAYFENSVPVPYSAATLNVLGNGNRVVTMPYDLLYIYTDPNEGAKAAAQLSARARVLRDVLGFFGIDPIPGQVSGVVPGSEKFAVRNFPNPFNPKTTISYTAPKAGHLTVKIFNVRGELVRTLVDGQVAAGVGSFDWDGSNNSGGKVSSGVYFYEARMGNDVVTNKMALVK